MIKIVLIEDHHLVREGIKALLEKQENISVVGEAQDGKKGIELVRCIKPDVVILDINLPNINGLQAAKILISEDPEVRIIILSMYSDDGIVRQSISYGVKGYLLKKSLGEELTLAVKSVMNGKTYLSPEISNMFFDETFHLNTSTIMEYNLTTREMEILQLIAEGNTNNQIAEFLSISQKTVEKHRSNLMSKLDLHDITDLVKYAIKHKIIFVD